MGKINLEAIKKKGVQDNDILQKVTEHVNGIKSEKKTDKKNKLTAQIKINLTPEEKERLQEKAGHNISAFVREILINAEVI